MYLKPVNKQSIVSIYKKVVLPLFLFLPLLVAMTLLTSSCGRSRFFSLPPVLKPPKPDDFPLYYTEEGIASWYGGEFHGRRTANGEIYDMYKYTAAHKYFPLGCYVKVINLKNNRSLTVKINDRGPFIRNRILDLSYGAAHALGMAGDGLSRIRLQIVKLPEYRIPENLFIQIGAFSDRNNAIRLSGDLASSYQIHLAEEKDRDFQPIYRVRVGPYPRLDSLKKHLGELRRAGFTDSFIIAH